MTIGAWIAGIDYALPSRKVSNSDLDRMHPEWSMEQVVLRTGVENRHWCTTEETALDLAEVAAKRLLERLGVAHEIDAIAFCTQSPDHVMPPNSALLQARLGLRRDVAAFDFTLACSGFIYGLYLAKALIASSLARNVLLITAETYSKVMNESDRGPATLFGDGAAATLVSSGRSGIGDFVLGTDGTGASCFMIPAGGARLRHSESTSTPTTDRFGSVRSQEQIYMDGATVMAFVRREIPGNIEQVLSVSNVRMADIDLVVFHQASRLALDFLYRALKIPEEKRFGNIEQIGNTVSASIPIALRDAQLSGRLSPGSLVLIGGFGVGLSWGSCTLRWE